MAPRQIQELMLEDQMWELIIKDQDLVYMALTDPKMEKVYSEVLNNKNAIMKYIDDPQVMSVFVKSCAKMATSLVVEYLKKDLREEIKSKLLESADRQFEKKFAKEMVFKNMTSLRISSRQKVEKKRFDIE